HANQIGDLGNGLRWQPAGIALRQLERWQQRRAPLRVLPDLCQDLFAGVLRQHRAFAAYLSTSPMTGSVLAITAIRSATSPPSAISGRACTFAKVGARSCTRTGFPEPSLTM